VTTSPAPAPDLHAELVARVQAHGLSPQALASLTGYYPRHISRVFRGDQPGSIFFWQALLDACHAHAHDQRRKTEAEA
jgi:AraC-like DNA-binding protein